MGLLVVSGADAAPRAGSSRSSAKLARVSVGGATGNSAENAAAKRDGAARPKAPRDRDPHRLEVPGQREAWFHRARRSGSGQLVVFLHGRGNDPRRDCERWARYVLTRSAVLCPTAPHAHGDGFSWRNDWQVGQRVVHAALDALAERHGRRFRADHVILAGFSEGAFVAMNVGLREPKRFRSWLVLGGTPRYWGGAGKALLGESAPELRRVVLLTGALDEVAQETKSVEELLRDAGVEVQLVLPSGMGHELALIERAGVYRTAISALTKRGALKARRNAKRSREKAR